MSELPSLPNLTSAQLISAGLLASSQPSDTQWFASFFAEEGDPDLYLQDLGRDRSWKIAAGGLTTEVT